MHAWPCRMTALPGWPRQDAAAAITQTKHGEENGLARREPDAAEATQPHKKGRFFRRKLHRSGLQGKVGKEGDAAHLDVLDRFGPRGAV